MTTNQDAEDRDLPPFPPESDWLDLELPFAAPGFVDRAIERLVEDGRVQPIDHDAAPEVPSELFATVRPPEPSAAFVARTLQAVQSDRAEHWRRLLLRYEAPEPTPDFIARTLLALRRGEADAKRPAPARRRGALRSLPLRPALLLPLIAAAAALVLLLRPHRPAFALREFAAAEPAELAISRSPTLLGHLLAGRVDDPAAPAPVDGAWLWLPAEARR